LTTAEAAAKWAEAKEALTKASATLDEAKAAYETAEHAEHDAWCNLEELAGRPRELVVEDTTESDESVAERERQMWEMKQRIRQQYMSGKPIG
jgi:hypothetical protein